MDYPPAWGLPRPVRAFLEHETLWAAFNACGAPRPVLRAAPGWTAATPVGGWKFWAARTPGPTLR